MENKHTYSVIGIGIGPFNLGLAALLQPVKELPALFFDESDEFNWHPGLMLDNATLQVPFLADLVTMADPTSRYSFLNFLKQTGRIYRFYIREDFFVLRKEYNAYCRWVASQLSACRFSRRVTGIACRDNRYAVTVKHTRTGQEQTYYARRIVLGIGTEPHIPAFIGQPAPPRVIHTSEYLPQKEEILENGPVTLVGSGQSAAEVFRDLLPETRRGLRLNWFTRSGRFFPLENHSKLTLELTSPDYTDYFYSLPAEKRKQVLAGQDPLYKGIDHDLINDIFNTLYTMDLDTGKPPVRLMANSRLDDLVPEAGGPYTLYFTQTQQQRPFTVRSASVILATGYKYREPAFLKGIGGRIRRMDDGLFDVQRNYSIDVNKREIFVQNAELHTHGFVTPDLGMGAYRNACIINTIAGREVYPAEKRIAFQDFGVAGVADPAVLHAV